MPYDEFGRAPEQAKRGRVRDLAELAASVAAGLALLGILAWLGWNVRHAIIAALAVLIGIFVMAA